MPAPTDEARLAARRRPHVLPVMRQDWHHLLFLHWEVPAASLEPHLPRGLEVDTFEDRAFVGLIPFTINHVHPKGLPPIPSASRFHETNLRTYVHHRGEPGIFFFSLEAASTLAMLGARAGFGLPYMRARMSMRMEGADEAPALEFRSERRWPGPKPARLHVRGRGTGPVHLAEPGTLEFFLVERYVLFVQRAGRLLKARVHHAPYPLRTAEAEVFEESLTTAAGLARPSAPPLVHYAREVRTEIFRPERA